MDYLFLPNVFCLLFACKFSFLVHSYLLRWCIRLFLARWFRCPYLPPHHSNRFNAYWVSIQYDTLWLENATIRCFDDASLWCRYHFILTFWRCACLQCNGLVPTTRKSVRYIYWNDGRHVCNFCTSAPDDIEVQVTEVHQEVRSKVCGVTLWSTHPMKFFILSVLNNFKMNK